MYINKTSVYDPKIIISTYSPPPNVTSPARINTSTSKSSVNITDPRSILSKTFGDFMQVLAIASRSDSKAPVHFASNDVMACLMYAFVRKYIYKKDKLNLVFQKNRTDVLVYN